MFNVSAARSSCTQPRPFDEVRDHQQAGTCRGQGPFFVNEWKLSRQGGRREFETLASAEQPVVLLGLSAVCWRQVCMAAFT